MKSCTGTPDNDLDHAEWLNGPEPPPPGERGRVLTAAEMHAELHRILGPAMARIRGLEHSAHRCAHGINLERATCGRCARTA